MDCTTTAYASSNPMRESGFEIFNKAFKNEVHNDFFADKTCYDALNGFPKSGDAWYFEKEEEVPRFYFPPISSLKLDCKDGIQKCDKAGALTKIDDKDIDCSVHSQTSTKAHYTKDNGPNLEFEFGMGLNPTFGDNQNDDIMLFDQVSKSPKKDLLPRLNEVFSDDKSGFGKNLNLNSKSTKKQMNVHHKQQETAKAQTNTEVSKKMPAQEQISNIDINKEIDFITSKSAPSKTEKNRKDLSKRKDVVNKTILRSMKRYYFTEFDAVTGFSMMPDTEKFANFHQLIKDFVLKEFKSFDGITEQELDDTIVLSVRLIFIFKPSFNHN